MIILVRYNIFFVKNAQRRKMYFDTRCRYRGDVNVKNAMSDRRLRPTAITDPPEIVFLLR